MTQHVLHLLKVVVGCREFLLCTMQFVTIKKTGGVAFDTCENSFDVEQVLYGIVSLIA